MRTALLTRQAAVLAAVGALGAVGISAPLAASAAAASHPVNVHHAAYQPAVKAHGFARPALPAGQQWACPAPSRPGQMTCMSIINTRAGVRSGTASPATPAVTNGFYTPSDLRKAYKLTTASARGGKGKTIAIVDAFNDPHAAADLAHYRSHFHLPACTTSNHCLRIVNQKGKASPLPKANANWAVEESLDLDMVSAICPNCHIVLVEATTPSSLNLGTAENTAVRMGAKYVSNSWSGGEFIGQDFFNPDFNHPGVVIDFASGDNAYAFGPAYPTDLQYVTAIGGTSLRHAHNGRGWTESVWGPSPSSPGSGTQSGCSVLEPKPSWQRADAKEPNGCLNRTETDVSADANPDTGVSVYISYKLHAGFYEIGGTSASTPIITAVYALAGSPTAHTYPSEYPYLHSSHLFDVTAGSNGKCETFRKYLCHAVRGYDGPTGLGTPDGTAAFTNGGKHLVTVTDPGTQDIPRGASVSIRIAGLDSGHATTLNYSAAGLPPGLSIGSVTGSPDGKITGTAPGTAGTFHVTVTAKNGAVTGTTHFTIVIVPSLAKDDPTTGEVTLSSGAWCLDGNGSGVGDLVKIRSCTASSDQLWNYESDSTPDSAGQLRINGNCLGLSGTNAAIATCNGSPSQDWAYLGFGELGNLGTGSCLGAGSLANAAAVKVGTCNAGAKDIWTMPEGPIAAGTSPTSLCLNNPGASSSPGTKVKVGTCDLSNGQQWQLNGDGTVSNHSGLCLSGNESLFSGTAVVIEFCNNNDFSQWWIPGPGGQLINANSGRCLADPGNGPAGTVVQQQDCYGEAGEVWGLN